MELFPVRENEIFLVLLEDASERLRKTPALQHHGRPTGGGRLLGFLFRILSLNYDCRDIPGACAA